MIDDIEAEDADLPELPATMADTFLALVGVVIIVLLSLAPAIQHPAALAGDPTIDEQLSAVTIDGDKPLTLLAEKAGLRISGQGGRLVPLDTVRDDVGLADMLRSAGAERQRLLLAIAPDGEETAFVFETLASALGIGSFDQLRLDQACSYVIDPAKVTCRVGQRPA